MLSAAIGEKGHQLIIVDCLRPCGIFLDSYGGIFLDSYGQKVSKLFLSLVSRHKVAKISS